jgi:predicted  nucleic acid-binding Zn-ribbon protein
VASHYDDLFDELKRAGERLAHAGEHQQEAVEAMKAGMEAIVHACDAALAAHREKEDLTETVARLETLVMELVKRQNGTAS